MLLPSPAVGCLGEVTAVRSPSGKRTASTGGLCLVIVARGRGMVKDRVPLGRPGRSLLPRSGLDSARGLAYDGELKRACGRNSVVECQLPKLDVAGSNPVARSGRKLKAERE